MNYSINSGKRNLILLLIGLGFLPFVFWPSAPIPFEIPKVWLFQRWVEVLTISGVWGYLSQTKSQTSRQYSINFIGILVLIFLVVVVVSSVVGVDLAKSWFGNPYRVDGLVTLFHLIGFSLWMALFWRKEWLQPVLLVLSVSSAILSLVAIGFKLYQVAYPEFITNWSGAIGLSFGQPNFLGGYLAVTTALWFYYGQLSKNLRSKLVFFFLGVGQVIAVCLTHSVASLTVTLLLPVLWFISQKYGWKSLLLTCIAGITVFWAIAWWQGASSREADTRHRIVQKLLRGAAQQPLLGWGWANVDAAFESVDWPMVYQDDIYLDKAHSSILEVLVTTGIVGLVAYLALVGGVLRQLSKQPSKNSNSKKLASTSVLVVMFCLFLIHAQTNVLSINEEALFWLMVGLAGRGVKS